MVDGAGTSSGSGSAAAAAAAVAGDPQAVRALWEQHRRWVAGVLLAYKPRDADLEDLLQDVAMTLVRKVHELHDPSAVRPWLRAVAMNAARAAARKPERRHARLRLVGDDGRTLDVPGQPDAASPAAAREESARVMELAMQLPEGYREPLLLKCVRGMSYREIGRVMGLPESTVETRIARGRRMLREAAAGADAGVVGSLGKGGAS